MSYDVCYKFNNILAWNVTKIICVIDRATTMVMDKYVTI